MKKRGEKKNNHRHFAFVFEENVVIIVTSLFLKVFFVFKMFLSSRKRKAGVFRFLRFAEHFRKAAFSWRISVNGRPNQRNKAAFSDSSGVVWTPPERETNSYNNNVFNQFWRLHRNRFCWKATIISWIIQLIKERGRLTSLTKIKRVTQRLSQQLLWCPRFLITLAVLLNKLRSKTGIPPYPAGRVWQVSDVFNCRCYRHC